MPYSDVAICNMALSRVGVLALINDLNETSAEGIACNLNYPIARDYVLSRARWPFATRYAALGQVAIDPNDDWKYSYRYPSNCVLAMRLVPTAGRIYANPIPYAISGDASGTLLLCDLDSATLEYVATQTNPGLFGDTLASAIAWRLGSEIAIPLGRSTDLRNYASQMFEREISIAKSWAFNQQQPDAEPKSSFERARYGVGDSVDRNFLSI